MLSNLMARSDLHGERIALQWHWIGTGPRPRMRLVRRRRTYPANGTDGWTVLDPNDVPTTDSCLTLRIERELFLPHGATVESGMATFVAVYYANGETKTPCRVRVRYYDNTTTAGSQEEAKYREVCFEEPLSVLRTDGSSDIWRRIICWKVLVPGPGDEHCVEVGRVVVHADHKDGETQNRFKWIAASHRSYPQNSEQTSMSVEFSTWAQQITTVAVDDTIDGDSGDQLRSVVVADAGLDAPIVYYYSLFDVNGNDAQQYVHGRHRRTAIMATGRHDIGDKLYRLLPGQHAHYDEPDPRKRGGGQLRQFLAVPGAAADQVRSLAEGLAGRHDVVEAHVEVLPHLARWIGWEPDLTTDFPLLRCDILQAHEIFRTAGTIPNLRALISRATGWDCKVKEFANNIFLTNAPETIRLWEIHTRLLSVGDCTSGNDCPSDGELPLTRTDGFDGHPVWVEHGGGEWLFFHSDRVGGRDVWIQPSSRYARHGKAYLTALFVDREQHVEHTACRSCPTQAVNEYPTVIAVDTQLWLFWASNHNGHWNIWGTWDGCGDDRSAWANDDRPFAEQPPKGGPPVNLSQHAADDRHPVALREVKADGERGPVWLFWQSNRRGNTDIWARCYEPSTQQWSDLQRVTRADRRHEHPAAACDGDGRIWLFFTDDLGDHCNIGLVIMDGASQWLPMLHVTNGRWRDEAPTAVWLDGHVCLFWHSNRDHGRWHIWGWAWKWDEKNGKPVALTKDPFRATTHPTDDKEPMVAVVAGGNGNGSRLRLTWRSQRRGTDYQSQTIDTNDAQMLANLRSFADRAHYTYDTRRGDNNWYSRDTVGIFITPDGEHPDKVDRSRRLIDGPLRQFIPINVRPVLFILPAVHTEYIYTYDAPADAPPRKIDSDYDRSASLSTTERIDGLLDAHVDSVPEWSWLTSKLVASGDGTNDENHGSVDFSQEQPINTTHRTVHVHLWRPPDAPDDEQ